MRRQTGTLPGRNLAQFAQRSGRMLGCAGTMERATPEGRKVCPASITIAVHPVFSNIFCVGHSFQWQWNSCLHLFYDISFRFCMSCLEPRFLFYRPLHNSFQFFDSVQIFFWIDESPILEAPHSKGVEQKTHSVRSRKLWKSNWIPTTIGKRKFGRRRRNHFQFDDLD